MTTGEVIISLCGVYSLALAIFHCMFWRLFNWKNELKRMSVANRAIIQIANIRLIYFFLFVAFSCFFYAEELNETKLGHVFLAGLSVFWLGRTVEQFIFLKIKSNMVNFLTFLFAVGTLLFALPLLI